MKDYGKDFSMPCIKDAGQRSKERSEIIRAKIEIPERLSIVAKNRTYHVHTFGCQANERDGEMIAGILEKIGYTYEADARKADVVILNTCAVRENAEEKVFGAIGNLKAIKKLNPNFIFGISGCMVQQEVIVNKIMEKHPQTDLIFGTHNIANLPTLLDDVIFNNKRTTIQVFSKEGEIYENLPSKRDDGLKAWVNIMYGCDKFCTYCIVPYTRGKERSRLKEDILNEVNDLIKQGYKEITLLGQNVNAYGNDLGLGYNFATLLNEVAKTNIPRIRFVTSHPWNFTKEMLDAICNNPNIMPYIHLPVQSGDDEVLRKMARRYTIEEYKTLVDEMKRRIPNLSLTTDIIVGFPNETEEQFQHTLDIFNYCKYDNAFTFIYSPREGTPAARMVDEVSFEEKHDRLMRLNKLVDKYALEANKNYEGQIVKVLVEGPSKRNKNILTGYSENNKLVNFKGDPSLVGKIVNVRIDVAKTYTLEGEVVE